MISLDAPLVINLILILIILLVGATIIYLKYTDERKPEKVPDVDEDLFSLAAIKDWIKETMNEITNSNLYDLGLNEEEYRRRANKRAKLKQALKECAHGDIQQKMYVKGYLYDLLDQSYGFTEENINLVLPFNEPQLLTLQDKFECLLYILKKKKKYNALSFLIKKYNLADLKFIIEDGNTASYIITPQEIEVAYQKEVKGLNFEDKKRIIVQRVYQEYKGFGVIDEIRDMNIDGVSGGVNGIPASSLDLGEDGDIYTEQMIGVKTPNDYDSVWIFDKGKSIYLSFLSFGSEQELKRVANNIYKYNNPGQLTETNGFKVNEMKDGSRVVVVRPNFSESYAFFVRKFDIPNANLDSLFPTEMVGNSAIVKIMLILLMKGRRVTAITGPQAAGKTTLMMAMCKYIAGTMNIRVHELAFELHLRKVFPWRNILTFRETETITSQQGLDLGKKTDGSVSIVGEVAEMKTASHVIQTSEVGSEFTVFSAHPNTLVALVNYMSNALVKIDGFSNSKAEEQVVNVLKMNIHLRRKQNGFRHLDRITEIIPLTEKVDYDSGYQDAVTFPEMFKEFVKNFTEYARRSTDRKTYEYRDIIRYEDGNYVLVNKISEKNITEMKENMTEPEIVIFNEFLTLFDNCDNNDLESTTIQLLDSLRGAKR